jgi:hypothetical protein
MERQTKRREIQQSTNPAARDFVPDALANRVQTFRTNVLNRLSHSGAHGLVGAEVQDAINTIRDIHNHQFPNQ